MRTRRQFLTVCGASATVASLGGCANIIPTPEDDQEQTDDIYPPDGLKTDDELLTSVADPSLQVPHRFFSGYDHRLSELDGADEITAIVPRLGGEFLGILDGDIQGVGVADCDRAVGSSYYALWSAGPLGNPVPSGQTVHVTGEFRKTPFVDWLNSIDGYRRMGADKGAQRYIADIANGRGFETWAVRDGRVVIVSRTDVTSRNSRYDTNQQAATEALKLEVDQIERDDAPIANTAPEFVKTVQALDQGPIRAGTEYATVPLGSDMGTEAFDDVVAGVVGGGVNARVGSESNIQRAVSYLEPEMADGGRTERAYRTAESSENWSFSVQDSVVCARASVDAVPGAAKLRTVLPVPGYTDYATRVAPGKLNRTPNPLAIFEGELAEDMVEITHTSGDAVDDLRVRYVRDGSVEYEEWNGSGSVSQGDTFESEGTVDDSSEAWLTWRPGSSDAAVLLRLRNE